MQLKKRMLFSIVLVAAYGSGCESLQRKFTREPRQETARPEPIFRFKDYAKAHSAEQAYEKAYESYRLWVRELIFEIDRSGRNTRSIRSASAKMTEALEHMHQLLSGTEAEDFGALVEQWRRIHSRLISKQVAKGEMNLISRDANAHMREVHRGYRPSVVQSELKSPPPTNEGD